MKLTQICSQEDITIKYIIDATFNTKYVITVFITFQWYA